MSTPQVLSNDMTFEMGGGNSRDEEEKLGLFLMNLDNENPDELAGDRYPIDIVAVHGITGDYKNTWTHGGYFLVIPVSLKLC